MSWPQTSLGRHIELVSGAAFKSSAFTDDSSDVPLVKGENIGQGKILWDKSKYWPRSDSEQYERFKLRAGDVILGMDRPWVTAGLMFAVINERDPEALLVQRVARLRGTERLCSRFLRYVIASPEFSAYAKNLMGGVNVPHISGDQIRAYQIALPTLSEQDRIADILSAYDDLIENNRRRIQLLEQAARLLYKEWFVHLRFPGHEHVKITKGVPDGWRRAPFGTVVSIVMGNSPKGDTYNDIGEGMPLVNGPVEFGEIFTERVKWTTKPTRVCKANDLVVCVRGSTTGRNVKSDGVYCLGRGVCSISGDEQSFIDELFKANLPALLSVATGATFPCWPGPALAGYLVLWPTKNLRQLFEVNCEPMIRQIRSLYEQNQRLTKARDLLLPRLMNGTIPV